MVSLEFLDPFWFKRLQSFPGRVDGHGPDVDNNAEGPHISRVNVEILSREVSAVISQRELKCLDNRGLSGVVRADQNGDWREFNLDVL